MFMQTITIEQRLAKAVVAWMSKEPALSGVMMIGERVIQTKIPTACTNGRDEWYGKEFCEALNDAQLRFVLIHEVYHKIYKHPTTWGHLAKIDARLANVSMDYHINYKIMEAYGKDGFVEMPVNITYGDGQFFGECCYDEQYKGWDTAKIFWHLYKKSGGDGEGDPGRGDVGNGSGTCPNGDGLGEVFDEVDFDGAEELTREEKQELDREIDEAIRQGQMAAGKTGSGGNRDLGELLEPVINWREALREFITSTCAGNDISTFRRPNRRYAGAGFYMPSGISETVECIADHNDMSGSIGTREQSIMITELSNICQTVTPDELHVTYWDTEVRGHEVYERHELEDVATRTKPVGGGGTDVSCVPEYLKAKGIRPQASIVLTDGYIWNDSWGEWDHPVLWVIVDNKRAVPPCGSVIHVKSEDF
jgi:predicted metal-dependent peptidase